MNSQDVKDKQNKYFQAVGRRKTSIASVRISSIKGKDHEITVNAKPLDKYFPVYELHEIVRQPLDVVKNTPFKISIKAQGGGARGQSEASRLGLARALTKFNQDLKKELKDRGYLTRDDRMVERKKPGLKKARRAPQFSKR
ncbi:MAG: 30S ribosomal protein S9 [Candidatus Moranbacteria bacterium]|nr:30S ribosomal protein S9 [Candidatus Moranbacteria bacterium]